MDKNNDGAKLMVRRRALQVLGVGLTTASGLLVLQGCNKGGGGGGGGGGGATGSCQDKGEPDENALTLRKTLQYKEKSEIPDKKCNICAQYEPGKYGDCGGCKLFAGGVNPEGSCLSFAPKQAAGAAPAPGAPAAPAAPVQGG